MGDLRKLVRGLAGWRRMGAIINSITLEGVKMFLKNHKFLRFVEQGADPVAGRCVADLSGSAVFVGRLGAALDEQADDGGLLVAGVGGACAAAAGGLDGEVERG